MLAFKRSLLHAAVITTSLFGLAPAIAAGPMQKAQAPGYYRMMVGDIEVTALSDGTVGLPMTKLLNNMPEGQAEKDLARSYLKDPVETSVNTYLINTGSKLVMVDCGAGVFFGPTLGKLLANIRAAGYTPEQIDEIYVTHMHADHVGGLMADGKPAFANAVVRADKRDADFWLSQAAMDKAPDEAKGFFKAAMATIGAYQTAGKFKAFDGDTELVPGVRSQVAYGHTPGHSTYVVESKGEKLVLWGDMMHVAAVQFAKPMVTITFDSDNVAAATQRAKAYAAAAEQGHWVGSTHLSFPGIGRLRANGDGGYTFLPAVYRSVP